MAKRMAFPAKAIEHWIAVPEKEGAVNCASIAKPVYKDDPGMTMMEYYAAHAPITFEETKRYIGSAFSEKNLTFETTFKIMAQMRFAYAKAMMEEAGKHD